LCGCFSRKNREHNQKIVITRTNDETNLTFCDIKYQNIEQWTVDRLETEVTEASPEKDADEILLSSALAESQFASQSKLFDQE
jgi:hypothetical protein